jgi:hypothetical protein
MRSYTVIVSKATRLPCSLPIYVHQASIIRPKRSCGIGGFTRSLSARLEICKTIVDHSWIVIAPRFGWHTMKASQEPLEETKVGDGDLGGWFYPTLPGKPVHSQDTLERKLLKACAGSNPTLDRRSVVLFMLLSDSSALTKVARFYSARQTPSSDPHTR